MYPEELWPGTYRGGTEPGGALPYVRYKPWLPLSLPWRRVLLPGRSWEARILVISQRELDVTPMGN